MREAESLPCVEERPGEGRRKASLVQREVSAEQADGGIVVVGLWFEGMTGQSPLGLRPFPPLHKGGMRGWYLYTRGP